MTTEQALRQALEGMTDFFRQIHGPERVRIMIFDGELSEAEAERLALADTWSKR